MNMITDIRELKIDELDNVAAGSAGFVNPTKRSDGNGATVGRANFDVFTCSKGIDTATSY
jgi:hypothetical protein